MQVSSASFNSSLQIKCVGTATEAASAVLGEVIRATRMTPGVGTLFFGYELTCAVIYNTATATTDLLTGELISEVGAPILGLGVDGKDWEGIVMPLQTGVRALLIEDTHGGTGDRMVTVTLDNGEVLTIPQGGSLLMVAPEGKLLPAAWHSLTFGTDTAGQQAWVKVSALTEYGD